MSQNEKSVVQGLEPEFRLYVVEALNASRLGYDHNIQYYDSVDEAVRKYNSLPEHMFSAIGFSDTHSHSALDLIQRMNGENILIRDFLNVQETCMDPQIHELAFSLCQKLNIQWESERMLGNPILVPLSYGATAEISPYDRYLSDKRLDYLKLDPELSIRIPAAIGPIAAIEEAYLTDKTGYISLDELFKLANASTEGYLDPARPHVSSFYINYIDKAGHFGGADISTANMRVLLDREKLLMPLISDKDLIHWSWNEETVRKLAENLDRFIYDYDPYEYGDAAERLPDGSPDREGHISDLIHNIQSGDLEDIRTFLQTLASDDPHNGWSLIAQMLISKIDAASVPAGHIKAIDHLLNQAQSHKSPANNRKEVSRMKQSERTDAR